MIATRRKFLGFTGVCLASTSGCLGYGVADLEVTYLDRGVFGSIGFESSVYAGPIHTRVKQLDIRDTSSERFEVSVIDGEGRVGWYTVPSGREVIRPQFDPALPLPVDIQAWTDGRSMAVGYARVQEVGR